MKIISLFFVAVLTIAARADIVYLSNGREIEGKATRKGDQVIIETPEGKTRTVAEKDVLYIAVGPIRKHSSSSKPTSGKSDANRAADHPDRTSLPAGGAAIGVHACVTASYAAFILRPTCTLEISANYRKARCK